MQTFATETKTIGAFRYKVTQLDAHRGRRAFMRLTKLIGPAMVQLQSSGKLDDKIEKAITQLVDRLGEDDVDYFCDLFASMTSVSGGDLKANAEPQLDAIFSVHFAGRYLEMLQWLIFSMKVNFASFFGGWAALLAPALSASDSPKEPTGSSGDS